MHEKHILCYDCGAKYSINNVIFRCVKCGGSLEVVFDYGKLKRSMKRQEILSRPLNHMRYRELYPVKNPVSMNEGGTTIIRSRNLEKELGLGFQLWFKNEGLNPTGSFKDRGSSVEIARAYELGYRNAVCASTGNMGASVSAYSSIKNIRCGIVIPDDAAPTKIDQIAAYGASVYMVKGDYTLAAEVADKAFREHGIYLLGDYLFRREGTKSVGFELADQMRADYIFCPVGNGTLISAVWKAYQELNRIGFANYAPKLIGVQAATCSPVAKAFKNKSKAPKACSGRTIAVAMECGNPLDGRRALDAIKESSGTCQTVTDREILKARELLARREGIFAEPAGAASLAGLIKSKESIPRGKNVLCLVTGNGLKVPHTGIPYKPIKIGKKSNMNAIFGKKQSL